MSRTLRVTTAGGDVTFAQIGKDRAVRLDRAPWLGGARGGPLAKSYSLLPPAEPRKILCVGRNYRAHAQELGNELPEQPLWFTKPPSSLLPPGGTVLLPPESERVDYEAELALVIGRRARRISREQALDYVFGYTVACDVTARDLQKRDGQWTRAKGFDTFCPLGPEVVSGVDPSALCIQLFVNDELRQDGNTRDMAFDVPALVAHASSFMTLEPGDVMLTGTPEGVGPLTPGDRVRVVIESVGELRFDVAKE